jgi:hypothetical protein
MLKLEVWRLLEAHETISVERGHFERAARKIEKMGKGQLTVPWHYFDKLLTAVSDVERISGQAKLVSTKQAAARTKQFLAQVGKPTEPPPDQQAVVYVRGEGCSNVFHHLKEITSRIRDDCSARLYFQVAPENTDLMREDVAHFGLKVEKVFWPANEDIAEAAVCLALGRTTACVFHLMRAIEAAVFVMAKRLRVRRKDQKGKLRTWGQLLP